MAEESLPEQSEDSLEEKLIASLEENFTLSDFNTAVVFGDSPTRRDDDDNSPPTVTNFNPQLPQADFPPPVLATNLASTGESFDIGLKQCETCQVTYSPDYYFCLNCGSILKPVVRPPSDTLGAGFEPKPAEHFGQTVALPPDYRIENYSQEIVDESVNFAVGSILDNRYKVTDKLGQGGFGDIYAVENIESYFSDVQVLKLVHTRIAEAFSLQSPEALRDSYRSQYKAWKVLSEKEPDFIVQLRDVRVIERRVGLLMEFLEGGTLLDLVESWGGKPQTQEQLQLLVRLFIQASRALHIIHKYNLIHCDIKPHNFLLDAQKRKCKLCDFELLAKTEDVKNDLFSEAKFGDDKSIITGTLNFMAPETFQGEFSNKTDIYALGVSFYLLLSGEYPISPIVYLEPNASNKPKPKPLVELNSLISPALDNLIQWCLAPEPAARPDSVADLIHRLLQLGISDEESNFSPVNLARLLLNNLSPIDREWLIANLETRGFKSMSEQPEFQQQDMIEEYCYTTSPFEILKEHCTGASLYAIANTLKIPTEKRSRDDLIKEIVTALGFLPGRKQAHGLESIRRDLEDIRIKLENAEKIVECSGYLNHAFAEIERAITLLIGFYGQTLYGKGLKNFLSKRSKNKPVEKMTLGEKVGALRDICVQRPNAPMPERVERIFSFPLIKQEIFDKLNSIVTRRNQIVHHHLDFTALPPVQNLGKEILRSTIEVVKDLTSNQNAPRVVQITSLQNDVFGRHFYEGYDEKGKKEKIFTTFGLQVGQLYWFVPLTNPARINPLIFPFEEPAESDDD